MQSQIGILRINRWLLNYDSKMSKNAQIGPKLTNFRSMLFKRFRDLGLKKLRAKFGAIFEEFSASVATSPTGEHKITLVKTQKFTKFYKNFKNYKVMVITVQACL